MNTEADTDRGKEILRSEAVIKGKKFFSDKKDRLNLSIFIINNKTRIAENALRNLLDEELGLTESGGVIHTLEERAACIRDLETFLQRIGDIILNENSSVLEKRFFWYIRKTNLTLATSIAPVRSAVALLRDEAIRLVEAESQVKCPELLQELREYFDLTGLIISYLSGDIALQESVKSVSVNVSSSSEPDLAEEEKVMSLEKKEDSIILDIKVLLAKPPVSPLTDALVNGKKIAFHIPSDDYLQSLLYMLNNRLERLKESGVPIAKPNYDIIVGKETSGWNGKLDTEGRVIINHEGAARLG